MSNSTPFKFPYSLFKDFDLLSHSSNVELEKGEDVSLKMLGMEWSVIVEEGCIALFWITETGADVIIDFKHEGEMINSSLGISNNELGNVYARGLSKTKLLLMNTNFISDCSLKSEPVSTFFHELMYVDIHKTFRQFRLLKIANIEERLERFNRENSNIRNLIPDRMLANYLGIHYTTLSRIKTRNIKKD